MEGRQIQEILRADFAEGLGQRLKAQGEEIIQSIRKMLKETPGCSTASSRHESMVSGPSSISMWSRSEQSLSVVASTTPQANM